MSNLRKNDGDRPSRFFSKELIFLSLISVKDVKNEIQAKNKKIYSLWSSDRPPVSVGVKISGLLTA